MLISILSLILVLPFYKWNLFCLESDRYYGELDYDSIRTIFDSGKQSLKNPESSLRDTFQIVFVSIWRTAMYSEDEVVSLHSLRHGEPDILLLWNEHKITSNEGTTCFARGWTIVYQPLYIAKAGAVSAVNRLFPPSFYHIDG